MEGVFSSSTKPLNTIYQENCSKESRNLGRGAGDTANAKQSFCLHATFSMLGFDGHTHTSKAQCACRFMA